MRAFNTKFLLSYFLFSIGIDLLKNLLHLNPDKRFTAAQALAHPYFQNYHDEMDEPTAEPFDDPLENRTDISVEEWKGTRSSLFCARSRWVS
ncbi:hypothetical protein PHET_11980 [Paragonimus heterotremus]|uniref:Uncharacterized protein n=1 Tax=Paragonimus heterotremus TaxID=100268 RepID=A0A8J4SEQ8_9TREM|nr:hypothetical protein PHET_11980 [Paragonimus heterotremus]